MVYEESGREDIYRFKMIEDSVVYVRSGMDESSPSVALPPLIFRSVVAEFQALEAERDTASRVAMSLEDQTFSVTLAHRLNDFSILLIAFSIILLGVLGWGYIRLRQEHRRRRFADAARRHLTRGQEDERRRLAREIHDGPVQNLHGLRAQLTALFDAVGEEEIGRVEDDLLSVVRELRTISEDLRPPSLSEFGVEAALKTHAHRIRQRHPDIRIRFDVNPNGSSSSDERLPEEVQVALFRIGQEAVNNAAQHAEPDRISVRLFRHQEHVILKVEDDGRGIDTQGSAFDALAGRWAEQGHYGLLGIFERARATDAEMDFNSTSGRGTRLLVRVPVKP